MWRRTEPPNIADAVEAGLRAQADRFDLEQAVAGLDALDELKLHPILAASLRDAGYGVFGEERYPGDRAKRIETEGERCDLVLTPGGRELAAPDREPTLFDPPDAVDLGEAFWLEVKIAAQHVAGGANPAYASHLLSAVTRDVGKLARDPGIAHAALLIVLFADDERTARHDLAAWLDHCLSRGLPVGSPCLRLFPINDRLGNGACAVALHPVGRNPD